MQVEPMSAYSGNWHTTAAAWNSCPHVSAAEYVSACACACVYACACASLCVCVCV